MDIRPGRAGSLPDHPLRRSRRARGSPAERHRHAARGDRRTAQSDERVGESCGGRARFRCRRRRSIQRKFQSLDRYSRAPRNRAAPPGPSRPRRRRDLQLVLCVAVPPRRSARIAAGAAHRHVHHARRPRTARAARWIRARALAARGVRALALLWIWIVDERRDAGGPWTPLVLARDGGGTPPDDCGRPRAPVLQHCHSCSKRTRKYRRRSAAHAGLRRPHGGDLTSRDIRATAPGRKSRE